MRTEGARDYLTKPLDVKRFPSVLDEFLQKREPDHRSTVPERTGTTFGQIFDGTAPVAALSGLPFNLTWPGGHVASCHLVLVRSKGGEGFFLLALRHFDEVKGAPKISRDLVKFLWRDSEESDLEFESPCTYYAGLDSPPPNRYILLSYR